MILFTERDNASNRQLQPFTFYSVHNLNKERVLLAHISKSFDLNNKHHTIDHTEVRNLDNAITNINGATVHQTPDSHFNSNGCNDSVIKSVIPCIIMLTL